MRRLGWRYGLLVLGFLSTGPMALAQEEGEEGSAVVTQSVAAEAGEEDAPEGAGDESALGAERRARADRLAATAPQPLSIESLELAGLELELGRYEDLVERLSPGVQLTLPEGSDRMPMLQRGLLLQLARGLSALGRADEAERVYDFVAAATGDLTAMVESALLKELRGDRAAAEEQYYGLIDAYNQAPRLSVEGYHAVALACERLGRNDPQLFKDALKAFDQAIEASFGRPRGNRARVDLARLFVDRYDSGQARTALAPVFEGEDAAPSPRALLTGAMIDRFDGAPTAKEAALSALEINPRYVEALVFLAELENESEDREAAASYIERALEVNPRSLRALTAQAGLAFLAGETERFEELRQRIFGLHPRYATFWVELSVLAMRNRLYPQALDFARSAVELDPQDWRGWGELGMNQLRLGDMEQGRASLETSFAGDPYNVWNKNTLDLLDVLDGFVEVETPRFRIVLDPDEADLLGPLVGELAERAYDSLAARYGFEPPTPIRIEVYPRHEDFSVRTVGLSGLGALGVSFGPVIAIDSPSARGIGDFNWGTTLWHEIAHTFTLGLTEGRIPRWLTEGLSVFEERQGPDGWTDDPSPDFLAAYAEGVLLGLGAMNDGFVRPSFPNQIGLSYYQASLVAEYVDRTWGFERVVEMLRDYRDGLDTEEIVRRRFDLSLEEFDERFWAYLDERFATSLPTFRRASETRIEGDHDPLSQSPDAITLPEVSPGAAGTRREQAEARPDDYRAQLAWGLELRSDERWDEAVVVLERARDLFPEYAGPGSAYHALADIAAERDDPDPGAEARHLRALVDINEYDYEAHRRLARLYDEAGRLVDELDILDRTLYIYPLHREVHERRAQIAAEIGRPQQRLAALRAVLALEPASRPRVYYEMAETYRDLGRTDEARRSVLSALELAPSYEAAQTLLLELVGSEGDS